VLVEESTDVPAAVAKLAFPTRPGLAVANL
jgi:hypothetical protein